MANNADRLPLDDLSIFVVVCDDRGFRAAAKRLGLSPAGVSERIALLEKRLNVPLLIRTTRSVSPTEAGDRLIRRVGPHFGLCQP